MTNIEAKIHSIEKHSDDVKTLYFTLSDGSNFDYVPGQYITVFFEGSSTPEGKAYSLSSAPYEPMMSITVKKIGEFSGLIHDLQPGDTMQVSTPYGFFNPLTDKPLVCVGAGVGISPIWSIVKNDLHKKSGREIDFYYTNKYANEVAFASEQEKLMAENDNYHLHSHITRMDEVPAGYIKGRINFDDVARSENNSAYLLCGSMEFVRDVFKNLLERGVEKYNISTEIFFEQ